MLGLAGCCCCPNCSRQASVPSQIQVVISGVVQRGAHAGCAMFNGTFVLDRVYTRRGDEPPSLPACANAWGGGGDMPNLCWWQLYGEDFLVGCDVCDFPLADDECCRISVYNYVRASPVLPGLKGKLVCRVSMPPGAGSNTFSKDWDGEEDCHEWSGEILTSEDDGFACDWSAATATITAL